MDVATVKLAGVFVLKSVHMWTAKTLVSWMGAAHKATASALFPPKCY